MGRIVSKLHYIKEAATEPLNIWSMVGFAAAAAYTQHWIPLAAGLITEATFLTVVPATTFYRRVVERRAARRNLEARTQQREELIKSFDPREREAVEYLRWMKNKIYENYAKFTRTKEIPATIASLDTMWESFVDLLDIYRRRKNHLRSINRQAILNQIAQAQRGLPQADGATRGLLERNVEILNRRLLTFDEIEKSVRHVEAQLQSIENFFSLVNDQVVTMNTIDTLTALDPAFETLISNIETTKRILEETTPVMNSLDILENVNNTQFPPRLPQFQMRRQ